MHPVLCTQALVEFSMTSALSQGGPMRAKKGSVTKQEVTEQEVQPKLDSG